MHGRLPGVHLGPGVTGLEAVLTAPQPPTRCKVGRWADGLSQEHRDLLEQVAVPGSLHSTWRNLHKDGLAPASASTWHRHWTGGCPCPPH